MTELSAILIAFIAAIPPTLAAVLSHRKITKVQSQVTPTNGVKTAIIIEQISDKVDSLSRRMNLHSDQMNQHIYDEGKHFERSHKLATNTNEAVNTKTPGSATIGEQVEEIHSEVVTNGESA